MSNISWRLEATRQVLNPRRTSQGLRETHGSRLGVHPHEAAAFDGDLSLFRKLRTERGFAAVGEIGLDYFYENSDRAAQRRTLESFLSLACDMSVPAIIHCRDKDGCSDAYEDLYAIVKEIPSISGRFVLHCYAGSMTWLERFVDLGACFGITGIVTFPKAHNIREIVRALPADKLLLETDSPYLAPVPHRGKQNHPRYLHEIASRVALERRMDLSDLAQMTTNNAFAFFGVGDIDSPLPRGS